MQRVEDIGVEPGDVLAGKYRVERVLGSGGMGVVVEATHTVLAERVALKFLKPRVLDEPKVKARFLQEAQASVRIRSPHVARVLDVGELDSGAPYIVMEYLEGTDLEAMLEREGRLEPGKVADFALQACEALAVAHATGIIHRDIKPANLFVTRAADGSPFVKVLDFGISKVLRPIGGSTSQDLTQTQTAMGSPPYMSPEQMRSTKTVDSRTDVWSLGVVLYRALSGRLPFLSDSMPELCAMVLDAEVTPLREIVPEIPEGLEMVVERCLQASTSERYQNVAAVAEALAPYASEGAAQRAAKVRRILVKAREDAEPVSVGIDDTQRSEERSSDQTRREGPGEPPGVEKGGTGTSFGYTQSPSVLPRGARRPLVLGGAAVIIVAFSVTAGMWLAGDRAPSSVASAERVSAPGASAPSLPATPALVTSAAPEPPSASVSAAASVEPPRSATSLQPPVPVLTKPPPRRPAPSPASPPPADPFATRH